MSFLQKDKLLEGQLVNVISPRASWTNKCEGLIGIKVWCIYLNFNWKFEVSILTQFNGTPIYIYCGELLIIDIKHLVFFFNIKFITRPYNKAIFILFH